MTPQRVPGHRVPHLYVEGKCDLILARPDQHVCWRDDDVPWYAHTILDRLRGGRTKGRAS